MGFDETRVYKLDNAVPDVIELCDVDWNYLGVLMILIRHKIPKMNMAAIGNTNLTLEHLMPRPKISRRRIRA